MKTSALAVCVVWLAGCSSARPLEVDADTTTDVDAAGPIDASEADAPEPEDADAAVDAAVVDASPPDAPPVVAPDAGGILETNDPSLPIVHDYSGAPPDRVIALVHAALDGLGFDPAVGDGPNANDRVFVGKHYLAWIDQTGFYGKMNGLWTLNALPGNALDFVLKEKDGRPVNLFAPGEDGDGRWPTSYKGGEHVEFPSRVPEANDNASCASGDWCNQYALNEAVPYKNTAIPWWGACNAGAMPFESKVEPIVVEEVPGGLKLVYEGRLVKEADGDGTYDGDACHADYLFPDGVRRPVFLRVGYELRAESDSFDRTMQIRNPAGNPSFAGDMSLIGGFVLTEWPNAHYLKRLWRYWRPETSNTNLVWSGTVSLIAKQFNDLTAKAPVANDVLVGWIAQPLTLAARAAFGAGVAVTISHVGPGDNDDVGACLCAVHGGIEMGGGLIHAGVSLPIAGGQSTTEARRRLSVPSVGASPFVHAHAFEAEGPGLSHGVGKVDGDGWAAATGPDAAGHMVFGPYATDWGGGSAQAAFWMMVDNNSSDDLPVVTLDIRDNTTGGTVATRVVRRKEFRKVSTYQRFGLDFNLDGRAGHGIETRVYWHDVSYVRVDKVVVNAAD